MAVALEFRRRFALIIIPILGLGAIAYLAYHIFEGDRGLKASWSVEQRLAKAESERKELMAERVRLEGRVGLLREDTLDRDMLDERLRQMLNLVQPNDVVILFAKPLAPDKANPQR